MGRVRRLDRRRGLVVLLEVLRCGKAERTARARGGSPCRVPSNHRHALGKNGEHPRQVLTRHCGRPATAAAHRATHAAEPTAVFSPEAVYAKMAHILGIAEPTAASSCLKRGILRGFIQVAQDATLESPCFVGSCIKCIAPLQLSFGTAAAMQDDGGGEDALVCGSCSAPNFITMLCTESPCFVPLPGAQNHCSACPDFGTCLGDSRMAHCECCGEHWDRGAGNLPCSECAGEAMSGAVEVDGRAPRGAWTGDPRIAATKPTVARRLVDALASAPEGSPEREEIAAAIVKALGEGGAVAAELRRIVSALSPPPPPGASAPRAR